MSNKKKVIKLIESYINNVRKNDISLVYGHGSTIKIRDIEYLTSTKSILIDCKVIFGEIINEEMFDTVMLETIISDAINMFYSNMKLTVSVNYDV
jgi:hypothetical protein